LGRDITVDPVHDEQGNIKQCEMNAGKGKYFLADLPVNSVVPKSHANTILHHWGAS